LKPHSRGGGRGGGVSPGLYLFQNSIYSWPFQPNYIPFLVLSSFPKIIIICYIPDLSHSTTSHYPKLKLLSSLSLSGRAPSSDGHGHGTEGIDCLLTVCFDRLDRLKRSNVIVLIVLEGQTDNHGHRLLGSKDDVCLKTIT
jgi:hypothetical protein